MSDRDRGAAAPWRRRRGLLIGALLLTAACARPDGRQLLARSRDALRALDTVRYRADFSVRGEGSDGSPGIEGTVTLRRLDLSGSNYLARFDGDVVVVRSRDDVALADADNERFQHSSIYEAGTALLARVEPALLYAVYDPDSLAGEIEAESVTWEGHGEIGGVPCDIVRVTYADDPEDSRWCLATTDHLPRRLEWIEGESSTVLEISDLEIAPDLPPSTFELRPPEGWDIERLVYGAEPGTQAPTAPLLDPAGGEVRLADLRGEVLVLDFWASWCTPCLASLRNLAGLEEEFEGRPVRFFAVNSMEGEGTDPVAFFRDHEIGGELLLAGDAVHRPLTRGSLPSTAVIDAAGRHVGVSVGYFGDGSRSHVRDLIERALGDATAD